MKKIYFGKSQTPASGNEPFWKPWGAGWLLRLLGFLVLLFALVLLLSLFKSSKQSDSSYDDEERTEIPSPIIHPVSPDPVRVPVDSMVSVPHDIANPGVNLPSPHDNNLPPFDEDDIVSDDGRQIVGDRLNVILNSSANDDTFNQWANEFKALYPDDDYKVVYYDKLTKLLQIQVPQDQRERVMQALPTQITDIDFKVFPDGLMGLLSPPRPNDPVFEYDETSWYFPAIQAFDAWQITQGSPDVVVAIVDSYFDLNHDDLNSDRIVKPYSVLRRTGSVAPASDCDPISFMHGSMVASQALGNINNGRGTAGIAPGCRFMPVSLGHQVTSIAILQGLLYAIYQGASVVNLSVGDMFIDEIKHLSLEDQIALSRQIALEEQGVWDWVADLANERSVTIVWAAGNENLFTALDASKRGNATIKVSAVDTQLQKADFSNFGNFPEWQVSESTISAPGVDILGAKPYNTYDIGPGTSFAAPIVTGAVALMKSLAPSLTTSEIIEILQQTGKPLDDTTIGPLLQIADALTYVKDHLAHFNKIMDDHSQFIGLWESTELNDITLNGQATGQKCRDYFDVQSTERGINIVYATDTKKDYTAPFTIEWQVDKIILHKPDYSRHPTETTHSFLPATFECRQGANGLLECYYTSSAGYHEHYYLRKVRQRQQQEQR